MSKQTYKNYCHCSDVEFTIKFQCEEEFEDFFCPFCGVRIEDSPIDEMNEDEDYDYDD